MFTKSPAALRRTTLCAVIATAATFSTTTFAATHEDAQRQITVNYADLDLSQSKDAAALYRRLQFASRGVCKALRGPDLASARRYKDCYTKALTEAVGAVNERTLTALHTRPGEKTARASRPPRTEGA